LDDLGRFRVWITESLEKDGVLPLRQKFGPFDFGLPETTATLPLTKGHLRRRKHQVPRALPDLSAEALAEKGKRRLITIYQKLE
jgi:hypothetical protein